MASITPSDSVVGIAATYLAKVADWDGVSQDVREALASAFEANDYSACIKDLSAKGIRPMPFINNLNKVGSHPISKRLARLIAIGDRSLKTFRMTRLGDNAYER